jgi:hypothetical protein
MDRNGATTMDESTDGVTMHSIFILKVVEPFRDMERLCGPLFEMIRPVEEALPRDPAPITLYNDACEWIEKNLGGASVRAAGETIGKNAYSRMRKSGEVADGAPLGDVYRALAAAVLLTIQDPKKRGWQVLEDSDARVVMRRTQTFNCVMQEGVLLSIARESGVTLPRVEHLRCTRRGDEFCDYEVRWTPRRSPSGYFKLNT